MKKFFLSIFLILVLSLTFSQALFVFVPQSTIADSGFDSDYGDSDYGSSDYGCSDYGGSDYDSDYDYNSNRSSGGSGSGGNSTCGIIAIICILAIVALGFLLGFLLLKLKTKLQRRLYARNQLKYIYPKDIVVDTELNQIAFDYYKKIETAWMNRNLEPVRHLLTDEMYNMYNMQLRTLLNNSQINVMKNFSFYKGHIIKRKKVSGQETIKIRFGVYCKDYIINEITKKVVNGDKHATMLYIYELTFIKDINVNNEQFCPSCGGKLKNQMSSKCEYCNCTITTSSNKYTLANKEMVKQFRL